jgi:hypothetical protein
MKNTVPVLLVILILICFVATFTTTVTRKNLSEQFALRPEEEDIKLINEGDGNTEIVVARYKENIDWLDDPPFNKYKVVCYNKGDDLPHCTASKCKIIPLPNIGRCDHTFLYHIVNNYDNLANITIFLPASCLDSHKIKTTYKLMYLIDKTKTTVILGKPYENVHEELYKFFINKHEATNLVNKSANPEKKLLPCPIRPFGRWFDAMFGDLVIKIVSYFSEFAIAKEHILQHPKEHYEKLLSFVDSHSNPEAGHYMERAWSAVFSPYPEECNHSAMDTYPEYFSSVGFEFASGGNIDKK